MAMSVPVGEWLAALRGEYLQDFVKAGGATVKFVVPEDSLTRDEVLAKIREAAERDGYLFAHVHSASTKVHLIDKVFNSIASQVPWEALARDFLRSVLAQEQHNVPDPQGDWGLESLASLNGCTLAEMRRTVNSILQRRLFRDYDMAQEFRIAMTRLCQARLDPQDAATGTDEAVQEWLRGELRLMSALKSALIFQRIARHNARRMVSSLSHWLHISGKAGMVVVIDISRLFEVKRPRETDGKLYYSPAAVIESYEMLRQFVDATDELHYCAVVVLSDPPFLVDERRGVSLYDALRMRIWDEVHDRSRANPLSNLIRLRSSEGLKDLVHGGEA